MKVAKQADGSWVLSSSVHPSFSGEAIAMEESLYIWIGNVFTGLGVAHEID